MRVLGILVLGVALAGRVGADGDLSATTASPLFRLEGFGRGKLGVADVSGDGRADLVLVSRHDSAEGQAGVMLWILERHGDGFAVAYQTTFAAWPDIDPSHLSYDLDVGDSDGDGRGEAVVLVKEWRPAPGDFRTRLQVIGRTPATSQQQEGSYSVERSSAVETGMSNTVRCITLLDQPLIAVGGRCEVRFFGWTGSTYAEVREKRVDLYRLVPRGHERVTGFWDFGPGIGLVEGIVPLHVSPKEPRLAIVARDMMSDVGSGALVVLAWEGEWKVDDLVVTHRFPSRLAAGDLIPSGSPELVVTEWDNADMINVVLYENQGEQWMERWRLGPQGEGKQPRIGVAGLAFANNGCILAMGVDHYKSRMEYESTSLDFYEWKTNEGVSLRARVPFDRHLLAMATYPRWEGSRDAIVVIEEGGIGKIALVPTAGVGVANAAE